MTILHRVASTIRNLFTPRRVERQLDDELRTFVDMAAEQRMRDGASAADARRGATLELGGVDQVKERVRDVRYGKWLEDAAQDIVYGARMLLRNRSFTAIAVLSIGIGVGATAAIFSFADGLLLRPLPVPRAGELYIVGTSDAVQGLGGSLTSSYRDYLDVRDRTTSFAGLAIHGEFGASFAVSRAVSPRMKLGEGVSANFFDVLEVPPVLGRGFLPHEDKVPGRDAVIVVGYDLWRDEFGADAAVLGREVLLNGHPFTIVGVAPERFSVSRYVLPAFFIPFTMEALLLGNERVLEARDYRGQDIRARLEPGVSLAAARAELAVLTDALARDYPATNRNRPFVIRSEFDDRVAGDPITAALLVNLAILAAAVLVVACANLSGLVESRAPLRNREIAMRLAIGATRFRLVRQLITESLMLAGLGAAVGVGIAYGGIRLFRMVGIPTDFPVAITFELDRRVLAVSAMAAVVSAILAGIGPALRSTRTGLTSAMKPADFLRQRRRPWRQAVLVAGQVALSVAILVIALAVHRAFGRELLQGPGYRTDHLLMMRLDPSLVRYDRKQTTVFYDQLIEKTRALPGVKSATLTSRIPMGFMGGAAAIVPEGYTLPDGTDRVNLISALVDESYFGTMNTQIVAGRPFQRTDREGTPLVAIVNERAAARYWPGGSAVGRRFQLNPQGPFVEIVGIARNTKTAFIIEPPTDVVFLSRHQRFRSELMLVVETAGDAASMSRPLAEVVRSIDSNMPLADLRTMEEFYDARAARTGAVLVWTIAALGIMGLSLAIVGVYGLVAYAASRRTREIGIRMAIGANRGSVLRMVIAQGMRLTLIGLLIGLPVGVLVQMAMLAVFPAQTGIDPIPVLAVLPLVLAVTAFASYLPARRAAGIDALQALRCE